MPLISSAYAGPPRWQFNGHLQTIAPNVLRQVAPVAYRRHQLELSDGDFLDLDFSFMRGDRGMLIIGHGLEGSADRPYVRGMTRAAAAAGFQVCAINFRSCSGRLNRLARMYHHGDYPDLREVIEFLRKQNDLPLHYVGFSMGGNIGLNLAARDADFAATTLSSVVAFSSPLDLGDSIASLDTTLGKVYSRRFWLALGQKLRAKAAHHPIENLEVLDRLGDWDAFDRAYTLPLHGYDDEAVPRNFYDDVSPVRFLDQVEARTLIVQALNDPMLGGRCYETAFAKTNDNITLEHPAEGGHVGFAERSGRGTYIESRTIEFITSAGSTPKLSSIDRRLA